MRRLWQVVRTHRDLRLVLGAGVISMSGDWMLHVGLAYYVYDLTGSTLASAGTLLAVFLPAIVLSSVAGVFVDRWNRKTTMVVSNVLLAAGLLPLLLVHRADQVWIVFVVAAFEGIVELFFAPAEQAMLPHLVADDDLTTANALNGQIRDVSRLVGSAIGGVVVATGGISALALADAATFLASAALVSRIRTSGQPDAAPADAPTIAVSRVRALVQEWNSGIRLAASHRVLRIVLIFALVTTFGEGIMGTLFVPFVRDVLHGSGQAYGLVVSVQAIGGVVGGLVAASIGHRVSAVAMFGFGSLLFGLIDLVMFLYPLVFVAVWPAAVCMVLVGVPGAITMAGFTTVLQRNTDDAFRGRIFGALGAVRGLAIVCGTLSAGFLGEAIGIVPVLAYQGVGYMIAGVVIVLALKPDRGQPDGDSRALAPVEGTAAATT